MNFKSIKYGITHWRASAIYLLSYLHFLDDKTYLKIKYRLAIKKRLDLKNPNDFNEKLQWLKLHNRKPEYVELVDKLGVRDHIAQTIGEEYLIPLLGAWDKVEDIDFDALPERFVLKCSHDSGSVILCRDKNTFNVEDAKKKLNKHLKKNLFWWGREWPYKDVKPRIMAEKYMEDATTRELRDYKFFCFCGKVKCFKIDYDRFKKHRANYYDIEGNLLHFGEEVCPPDFDREIQMPHSLGKMIELAETLSAGHPFLRVDFYEIDEKIYFGELTFFPASGFGPFIPNEWDMTLGSWLQLPERQ